MSFDFSSSLYLQNEDKLHVNVNDKNIYGNENLEILKILKPNFQNELDFHEL
jgi:hypothetical protein